MCDCVREFAQGFNRLTDSVLIEDLGASFTAEEGNGISQHEREGDAKREIALHDVKGDAQ